MKPINSRNGTGRRLFAPVILLAFLLLCTGTQASQGIQHDLPDVGWMNVGAINKPKEHSAKCRLGGGIIICPSSVEPHHLFGLYVCLDAVTTGADILSRLAMKLPRPTLVSGQPQLKTVYVGTEVSQTAESGSSLGRPHDDAASNSTRKNSPKYTEDDWFHILICCLLGAIIGILWGFAANETGERRANDERRQP